MTNYSLLLQEAKALLLSPASDTDSILTKICLLLQTTVKHYDWVGFYFANHLEKTLHLKAYAGIPTDHTVIPFGKGICGQVAISNKNFVVDDVSAQDNYIACDIHVKSEIVIFLFCVPHLHVHYVNLHYILSVLTSSNVTSLRFF